MIDVVEQHRAALVVICRSYDVERLDLFGSAVAGGFDPATSDLDFLVLFHRSSTLNVADRYFGLLSDLGRLFDRKVDLVDVRAHRNPYFMAVALKHHEMLYAA